jgi:hypothetical protein
MERGRRKGGFLGRYLKSAMFQLVLILVSTITMPACGGGSEKSVPHAGAKSAASGPRNPLASLLLIEFSRRNPRIDSVAVVDLRALIPGGPMYMIGWGVCRDGTFRGRFDDELFGVFEVSPDLTAIKRTYDIIPSEAWHDQIWHFAEIRRDSIVVLRTGLTYADEPIARRAYLRQ